MEKPELKIRRARRLDFAAVMGLVAGASDGDRRTLRRYRHIVADLGADLYVAETSGEIVGVVHATYSRQLGGGQRGRIEDLAADPERAELGVERALLDFILRRARKRECSAVSCVPSSGTSSAIAEAAGLRDRETQYACPLADLATGDRRPASGDSL